MTPIACAKALSEFLQEKFDSSDFTPTDEKTAGNGITIRDGFLPKKLTAQEKAKQDPCIVIRPVEITDTHEDSQVKLQLLAVTYNSDMENGHLELYHIMEYVRQVLEQNPIIAELFMLQMPVKTIIPEDQPWPEWWAYMELTYTVGLPGMSINRALINDVYYKTR
ncbi:hypothetical protein [Selenomonas ruminantium]|uniref:hypothetical protein n=1 Tax=Selenomonas ruminantium TaxID=971 RepID=UPI000425F8F3|nr:hypothetical protein [Selenomonas ruminantium]